MKEIKITCQGADWLPIEELENFQGNLKSLTEGKYKKLRASIEKHGFSFPVFVWRNGKKNCVIDGHQRLFVIMKMMSEGFTLDNGKVPVDWIEAKTEKEAKEKILLAMSQYGAYDNESLYEFIEITKLNFEDVKEEIDLPMINLDEFELGYYGTNIGAVDLPSLREGNRTPFQQMTFTVHDEQAEKIKLAIKKAISEEGGQSPINENSNGNALAFIVERFNRG